MNALFVERFSIPYPVGVSDPILVDEDHVRIALRGVAATLDEISFQVEVVVASSGEDWRDQGEALSAGRPFNMPFRTPDPDALTVRCRWRLKGSLEDFDDTDVFPEHHAGPHTSGSWSGGPEDKVWRGLQLLKYPVPVPGIESFTIELSWHLLKVEPVQRVISALALEDSIDFATKSSPNHPMSL
ncbi:hypothetical protein [Arthrobacter alpinus]|uniref:hypothetical protein n=1 Tax=Arthrobacter alpinus TaxID=656366 RepID=UPI00111480BC|nr:hypothetical protein [Arthrobacter alpinus]